jgi:bacterioferritin-associated ferredoxin
MYLCLCKAVTESDVRELARRGVRTKAQLVETLGLDQPDVCGRCIRDMSAFMACVQDAQSRSQPRGLRPLAV